MKKVAVILSALALCACTKEWKCTITTDHTYMGETLHSESHIKFTGTRDEMKSFEANGTKDTPGLKQTTVCH
jgi:hypothetical protein